MSLGFPWNVLRVDRTADPALIRRAYAELLKAMDPDADPAAFARLRQARDAALRQAKAGSPVNETGERQSEDQLNGALSQDSEVTPWAYAAPVLNGEGTSNFTVTAKPAPDASQLRCRALAPGFSSSETLAASSLRIGKVFDVPVLSGDTMAEGLRPVQKPDVRLHSLLFGDGSAIGTPLSDDDEREALSCMRMILRDAQAGDLTRHNAADAWLSDLMARSWPRCAPLLEEASRALGWANTAGRIGERKAVAFVNSRLAGYLFQRDVQQSSHPLHGAWVELSRPGRAGLIRLLPARISPMKRQVRDLLKLVQRQFPEIESFLDPQRVGSWEASMPSGRRYVFRIRWWAIALVAVFRILLLVHFNPISPDQPVRPQSPSVFPTVPARLDPALEQQANAAVSAAFGPGKTMDWLRTRQPDLADWVSAQAWSQSNLPDRVHPFSEQVDREVLRRVYLVARTEGGANFDAAMRVRAGLIAATLRAGSQTCSDFLRTGYLPGAVDLSSDVRRKEQKLASDLVELGKLPDQAPPASARALVPGVLIDQVMATTGLSRERVARALNGKNDTPDRCAVDGALIEKTLKWHGNGREAILLTL